MKKQRDLLLEPDMELREGRIVVILEHWRDCFETGSGEGSSAGGGCRACSGWYSTSESPVAHTCGTSGVLLLPGMSRHASVLELSRALGELRFYAPGCSAHLFGYFDAPFRQVRAPRRVRNRHGKWRVLAGDLSDPSDKTWSSWTERVVPSWVDRRRVEAAVLLVAKEPRSSAEALVRPWCFRGNPKVPEQLLRPGSRQPEVAA